LGFAGSAPKKVNDATTLQQVTAEDLVKYGFIAEFCGRFPVIETLDPLSRADLARVLVEPDNALVRQFKKLFRIAGVELEIAPEVLEGVVDEAITKKTGARGLRGALESRLKNVLFTIPDLKLSKPRLKKVIVDKTCAEGGSPQCEFRPPKIKLFPPAEAKG
jgi:ATP-dependent Clp protease ATP-binding subunit ClpX